MTDKALLEPLAPIEVSVAKLELKPTDILVLKLTRPLTTSVTSALGLALRELRGDDGKVMILQPGDDLTVIEKVP